MKKLLFIALLLHSVCSIAIADDYMLADIGFYGEDTYISVQPDFSDEGTMYRFGLCRTSSGECEIVSKCTYSESALRSELLKVKNTKVRDDFEWIFYSSGFSSEELSPFIDEFKNLLKRANPKCKKLNLDFIAPMA